MFCYTARQHQAAEIVAAKTGLRPLKILGQCAIISPINEQTSTVFEQVTREHLRNWIEQHVCPLEQLVEQWLLKIEHQAVEQHQSGSLTVTENSQP